MQQSLSAYQSSTQALTVLVKMGILFSDSVIDLARNQKYLNLNTKNKVFMLKLFKLYEAPQYHDEVDMLHLGEKKTV